MKYVIDLVLHDFLIMYNMKHNIDLSDMILLHFLALIRIFATINAQKVEVSNIRSGITENYIELQKNPEKREVVTLLLNLCSDLFRCGKLNHDGDADGGVG